MSTTKREVLSPMIDDDLIEKLMAQVDAQGVELLGPDGVLTELTKRIMERALDVERSEHLGYERGDRAGVGSGNSRNGASPKTVLTDAGAIALEVPRDRNGTFEPMLVPKHQRRLEGFNDLVSSLVARGTSTRDTIAHLYEVYGVEIEVVPVVVDFEVAVPRSRPACW